RLVNSRWIAERRGQEVLVLERIAFGRPYQCGVVEHLLAGHTVDQHAEVERVPVAIGMQAKLVVRSRVTEDYVIVPTRRNRGAGEHAARLDAIGIAGNGVVIELLLALRVHAGEDRTEESAERLPRNDALRELVGLSMTTGQCIRNEASSAQVDDFVPVV